MRSSPHSSPYKSSALCRSRASQSQLCPPMQDLNGKLEKAFRKTCAMEKGEFPASIHPVWFQLSAYYAFIVIVTSRLLHVLHTKARHALHTHTKLPAQRRYLIYTCNNKSEFQQGTNGTKKRINKNEGMTTSFPWSLNSSRSDSHGFHGAIAMPPKIAPCSCVDGTVQFSTPGKAPFKLERYELCLRQQSFLQGCSLFFTPKLLLFYFIFL